MPAKIKIILVDWDQCPLVRFKEVGSRIIECGIQPFLEGINEHDKKGNIEVTLVISSDNINSCEFFKKYKCLIDKFEFITSFHIRNNYAMDIGAYDFGFKTCLKDGYSGRIMFVNSSVSGPHSDSWLSKYEELFTSVPKIGLSGATVNMIPDKRSGKPSLEHVQSWLLYSDMTVLSECFGDSLLLKKAAYRTKTDIICNGEIAISQKIINNGYGINCMAFPELHYFKGDQWPYAFKLGWRLHNKELLSFMNTTIV
jgi:hypothetical protein